jgi:hypothetical protein
MYLMKTKKILALGSLACFVILYQNCATQNRNMYREVRLESEAKLEVADQKGNSFLTWSFSPSNETSVEITNSNNSFCKRGFVLSTPSEKEWFFALSKLTPKRNTASDNMSKNLRLNYKGEAVALTEAESLRLFDLMEKTKKNHDVRILECDGQKKWSFRKVKAESLTQTNANSKIVQTFSIKLINDKVELALDEQPIKIAKNQDEAFCNYTGMTYSPSSKLLTAMFSIDEVYKNENLSGSRGLASAPENLIMIEIDDRTKYSIDAQSALGNSLREVINQMKTSKAARKTCGYTY